MFNERFLIPFVAFLQYGFGIYVFKEPDVEGCGPLISAMIIMISALLLLVEMDLYPAHLRKLFPWADYIVNYIINTFMIEHIMGSVWFPLEHTLLNGLPKIGMALEDLLWAWKRNCGVFCKMFKWESTGIVASYFLSFVIFLCVLHATYKIDLSLLETGITFFMVDVNHRIKKKIYKVLGIQPCKRRRYRRATHTDKAYISDAIDD